MARNSHFNPEREPLRDEDELRLNHGKIHGPFSFLNPTQARYTHTGLAQPGNGSQSTSDGENEGEVDGKQRDGTPAAKVEYKWTSRNNRKGRHALVVYPTDDKNAPYTVPPQTTGLRQALNGIGRMFTEYPIWDVSYLVAVIFTWGSVIWVINAFFAFLPLLDPTTSFSGESLYGGGITAFIGATVFEIGSVLLMFEAVNENRSGCFGYALEKLYDDSIRILPSKQSCTHHHQNKKNFVGQPSQASIETYKAKSNTVTVVDPTPRGSSSWIWFPSWHELTTHYFRDLGFLACSSQMFGATVFWVSGFTALPGIYTALNTTAELNGAYWIPQIIGGCGFVVSGVLFTIETQKHWWLPAPTVLGWNIGMWNLIGGIGFTLCGIFGLYANNSWAVYQASCSTFWGSWAFLIGSAIQWYESLDKHPVENGRQE